MSRKQKGFTLIELLVVISIIGVLSTIAMTSLNGARIKARTAVVNVQMNNFKNAVVIAQETQNVYLKDITGSTYSAQYCLGRNLRDIPVTDSCYIAWTSALSKIELATEGIITNLSSMSRDPWGSPYILDENEGANSGNVGDPCRADHIFSAGPDGYPDNGDDIKFWLPFIKCPG